MLVFKTEVIQAAGSLQVCAGQFVFIESATVTWSIYLKVMILLQTSKCVKRF